MACPLLLHDQSEKDMMNSGSKNVDQMQFSPYIKWLDQKMEGAGPGNVINVAFGSQSHMTDLQMDEIALGWRWQDSRSSGRTWVPPVGWEDRVKGRGLAIRDWVDQRGILKHPAIGGFLTHCGWNSVLEVLSMVVPLLAWPMGAEQGLNAWYTAMGLKAGLMIVIQESDANDDPMTFVIRVFAVVENHTHGLDIRPLQPNPNHHFCSEVHVHIAMEKGERLAGAVLLEVFSCAINSGFDGVPKGETSNS
ncbi:hypothetical protein SADUNF_Sadunf05G0020200 [Salix dunnii]|uniref:UDP-glycosyltransferases domain-containing protein n=1 Tax=Salix dunnii TaxID=1413687 RepID=A0A835KB19_9ROSI|nr:hypothetical protein SADUNF_Sadunf05G0020200 [Salix dunnii]